MHPSHEFSYCLLPDHPDLKQDENRQQPLKLPFGLVGWERPWRAEWSGDYLDFYKLGCECFRNLDLAAPYKKEHNHGL